MELLVVILVVGVLAGMLMPALSLVRNAARDVECKSNLRQFGLAFMTYVSDQGSRWPNCTWDTQLDPYVNESGSVNRLSRCSQAPKMVNDVPVNVSYEYCGQFFGPPADSTFWKFCVFNNSTYSIFQGSIRLSAQKCVLTEHWEPNLTVATFSYFGQSWGSNRLVNDLRVMPVHRKRANFLFADGHVATIAVAQTDVQWGGDPMYMPYNPAESPKAQ
jgi:prepilin-type processing-associated H-X9-DG protein